MIRSPNVYQATSIQHLELKRNDSELPDMLFTGSMFSESLLTCFESIQHALKPPRLNIKDMQKFSFEEDPYNEKVLRRNPLHFGKVKLNQNEKVLTHNFSKKLYQRSIKIHKKLDKGHSTKKSAFTLGRSTQRHENEYYNLHGNSSEKRDNAYYWKLKYDSDIHKRVLLSVVLQRDLTMTFQKAVKLLKFQDYTNDTKNESEGK